MVAKRIIIHHSLTKDSGTVSWGAIRRYHIDKLHWSDIGYHGGVELVKSGEYSGYEALMGRAWDFTGAHTKGQNHDSLGLCIVGNFDMDMIPAMQLDEAARIVRLWMRLFGVEKDKVFRHSDFAEKTCPGLLFPWQDFLGLL